MKKAILFGALAIFALSACKKDYTCTCTVSGQTVNFEIQNAKKKDAESSCNEVETTYQMSDPNASCSL